MNKQLTLIISTLLLFSGCVWNKKETKEPKHHPHKTNSGKKHHKEQVETQAVEPQFDRQKIRRELLAKCKEKGKTAECENLMKESTTKSEAVKTQARHDDSFCERRESGETGVLGRERRKKTRVLGREKKGYICKKHTGETR